MASQTTLSQIWLASEDDLTPILASQGRTPSGKIRLDRVRAAIIYLNTGQLVTSDHALVRNPNFNTVMQAVDTLDEGRALLSGVAPIAESVGGNAGLKAHFERLAELEAKAGEMYKSKAFDRAAIAVGSATDLITTAEDLQNIMHLKKQGRKEPSTLTEAREYLATGTSTRRQALEGPIAAPTTIVLPTEDEIKRQQAIELLASVHGIGPKTAPKFYDAGYRTLEDLTNAPLNHAQAVGLRYYYHFKERIPRSEMDEYVTRLKTILPPDNEWLIAGSYRRNLSESGDIDILMRNDTGTNLDEVVAKLVASGLVIEIIAGGPKKAIKHKPTTIIKEPKKFMGAVQLEPNRIVRRLDIRLFDSQVWPYALLYNTGSQRFNILCRQQAINLGLHLNEYELTSADGTISYPATNEEDIFRWLHIKYLTPEQRTNDLAALESI